MQDVQTFPAIVSLGSTGLIHSTRKPLVSANLD